MTFNRMMQRVAAVVAVAAAALGVVHAGTISVAWDAVTDSDLAGYKVYYGTTAGTYTTSKDVGNVTSTTLSGLDACTKYYIAVKAYDTAGLESTAYSNEVNGLPRPVVTTVAPASGEQGATLTLTLTGESYDGTPTVDMGSGISVTAVRRTSCTQLSVDVRIDAAAVAGTRDVTVTNPDRSYGTKTAGFSVTANAAPSVTSATPAAGATAVAVAVHPSVTFSERMDATSVNATTVRLLDASGVAVAQAAGSPALSADGLTATITPSANLKYSATYRTTVTGGTAGVKDASGKTMAADWQQNPGFTTVAAPDTTPPTVSSTAPADGATGVSTTVKPQVVFSEAMQAGSITSATVKLLDASGNAVAQAAGSPALSTDHKTATITPAAALAANATYKIQVVGGSSGAKDEAGNALASTFTQGTGFKTQNTAPGAVGNNRRTDTH